MGGKKPKFKPSYKQDAKYLRRLAIAVEHDEGTGTMNWRIEISSKLREVAQQFEDKIDGQTS